MNAEQRRRQPGQHSWQRLTSGLHITLTVAVLSGPFAVPSQGAVIEAWFQRTTNDVRAVRVDGSGAGLVVSGDTLYGTTPRAGSESRGTLFAMNIDGTEFRILHAFGSEGDASQPWAELVTSGKILYGTTAEGGRYGEGTVFAIHTDGTAYKILGRSGVGTIFKMNTDGTGFSILHARGTGQPGRSIEICLSEKSRGLGPPARDERCHPRPN
jgi:uncharacterized repeat protein (TIGR03803 family)